MQYIPIKKPSKHFSAMSNTFDIKRFWKYLSRETAQAKNNFGLSLLISGLLPVIFYFFFEVIYSLISGEWGVQPLSNRITMFAVAFTVSILNFPVKQYGKITDKRFGAEYLMLPASTFEKWLSMVAVSCIIVPFVLFALLLGSDALMSLIFPGTYGQCLTCGDMNALWVSFGEDEVGVAGSPLGILWLNWIEMVLCFNLGVLVFKKSKIGKTFLVMIGFSFVCSILSILIVGDMDFESWLSKVFEEKDPQYIINTIYWFIGIIYAIIISALAAGLYARIRTLKL